MGARAEEHMNGKKPSLAGRRVLITGSSRGLGKELARAFLHADADVMLNARREEELRATREELAPLCSRGNRLAAHRADVSRCEQVTGLVEACLQNLGGLDVLVNNAGILGAVGRLDDIDWDQWLGAVEVNLLGTVAMCRAALPHLGRRGRGKIINLSGGGASKARPRFSAYAVSKIGVVGFTETLAAEVRDRGIDVNAVAPGALGTTMLEEVINAGPDTVGTAEYENAQRVLDGGGASPQEAAALVLWLASTDSDGISGKLISAVWDPWRTFADQRQKLAESEIYTLRRVIPA